MPSALKVDNKPTWLSTEDSNTFTYEEAEMRNIYAMTILYSSFVMSAPTYKSSQFLLF